MKFLCDRCKTRYSIGDERVRGKILKIRCKNCANVITVREGMTDSGAVDAPSSRGRPTTGAPSAFVNANPGPAAARPPAALEEEWYVSIDGDQSGPFSLAEAQAWIGAKPFDAELHCWSEGFDDWLPVDKVSHFRGLRKRPQPPSSPPAPPPIPRAPTSSVPRVRTPSSSSAPVAAAPVEPEPKPLFAATMAALERDAEKAATRTNGAKSHESQPAPLPANAKIGTGPQSAIGMPSISAKPASKSAPNAMARTSLGVGSPASAPMSAGQKALAEAFDTKEDSMSDATALESPSFNDEIATRAAAPAAVKKSEKSDFGFKPAPVTPSPIAKPMAAKPVPTPSPVAAKPAPIPLSALAGKPLVPPPILDDDDDDDESSGAPKDDDNLEIGEVSRVVNLADLVRSAPKPRAATASPHQRLNATGPMQRINATGPTPRINSTGPFQRMGGTASVPRIAAQGDAALAGFVADPGLQGDAAAAPQMMLGPSESAVAQAPARESRRGMFILLGVAGLLLAGVVVAVVVLFQGSDDGTSTTLSRSVQYDTSRPDEPDHAPRNAIEAVAQSAQLGSGMVPKPIIRRPVQQQVHQQTLPEIPETPGDPTKSKLNSDEISDMAQKQGEGTKRCYMRAQKGALGIDVAEIKRIDVTMEIDKEGKVTSVSLSDHTGDQFGQCLLARIKAWKFRASPGGTFRFPLVFSSG